MKESGIVTPTELQATRITQLVDGMRNIKAVEKVMKQNKNNIIFFGNEDNETCIDNEIMTGAKGGMTGIYRESYQILEKDEETGKWTTTVDPEMQMIAYEVVQKSNERE